MAVVSVAEAAVVMAAVMTRLPIWNLLAVWGAAIWLGTGVRWVYGMTGGKRGFEKAGMVWGVLQTFVFISFTRLFFRSGSNLDPALANEQAWATAKNMVHQIGSPWNWGVIPDICVAYKWVFLLFVVGMAIHWLPVKWKQWYRLNFALLPLPVMAVLVVMAVVVIYQFVSAEMQAFIYFQF